MARCAGIKRDGGWCEVVVTGQRTYCYHHDPTTAQKRKRVAAKGGKSKPNRELAASTGVSLFDENGLRAWIREVDRVAADQEDGKVSTIDGRVVSDQEAYDVLLDSYESRLEVLAQLYDARNEDGSAFESDPSLKKQWSDTYDQLMNPVKEILAKLDALEGRNPELATDERVSRRAELAARQEGIESGDHAPDVADNIRKLAELRDAEVLSDEEFEAKKRDLLDRM